MILRLLLVFSLSACASPAYYLQAMSGQKKLMQSRQDIQSLLNDPGTSPELTAQLQTAQQIKAFALSELGLTADGSYSSYVEVEADALVWNVIATGEFSLKPKKWCFPVAGCVPYRGYFDQQKAQNFAERLSDKGLDVIVSPAAAYSSLGWFNDPLLSTMLSGSDTRLAAFLFHELAHQRLYIKNDGLFNEGYASFVEETGVRAWLELNQQQNELQDWLERQDVSKDFSNLIGKTQSRLATIYLSGEADTVMRRRKSDVFNKMEREYQVLSDENWQGKRYYSAWFKENLNNARLALFNTYEGSFCAFQGIWDKSDGNWQAFHRLAEEKSRLPKQERQEWLKESCPSIAPQTGL